MGSDVIIRGETTAGQPVPVLVDTTGVVQTAASGGTAGIVSGPDIEDAPATVNKPVPVGGIYHATAPTYTDGDRTEILPDSRGNTSVRLVDSAGTVGAGVMVTGDAFNPVGKSYLCAVVEQMGLTSTTTMDRLRTANIFKTITATASGDTAVWTPASSKRFRLMAYMIQLTGDSATAGGAVIDFLLRDATTATAFAFSTFVPAAGGTILGAVATSGFCAIMNGFSSAAVNNALNINLSAALSVGKVRVTAIGTEEV